MGLQPLGMLSYVRRRVPKHLSDVATLPTPDFRVNPLRISNRCSSSITNLNTIIYNEK